MSSTIVRRAPEVDGARIARDVAAGLVVGALGSLCVQGMPPLHLPTHELSQGASVVGLIVGMAWSAHLARRVGPARAVALAFLQLCAVGAGLIWTHVGISGAVHGCRTGSAPIFFWATWLPVVFLASVLGAWVGTSARPVRVGLLTFIGVLVLCVIHDVGQLLVGVRIVDPLLGEPLAFDQRARVRLPPVHLLQRTWLAAVTLALWWWLSCPSDARPLRRWRARLAAGGIAAVTLLGGSHIGLGWGTGALRAELDQVRITPNFRIRYASAGTASLHIDAIAEEAEWHFGRLTEVWDVSPPLRVRLNVYDDARELKRISGASSARAGLSWVDLHWWDAFDDTLPHELVHAIHYSATPNPLIVLSRTHLEGTAVAWAEGGSELAEEHVKVAAAHRSGHLPTVEQLLSPVAFMSLREGVAYDASGSLLAFVAHRYGWPAVQRWQRTLSLSTLGTDAATLDADWRAFLDDVPVELAEVYEARASFDPALWPGYLRRRCPKLGPLKQRPAERAQALLRVGHPEAALSAYRALADTDDRPRWQHQIGRALSDLGRGAEAMAVLEGAIGMPDIEDDEAARLLDLLRILQLRDEDWAGLEASYAARLALQEDVELSHLRALMADPGLRDALRDALLSSGRGSNGSRLLGLLDTHPDNPHLRFLALSRSVLVEHRFRHALEPRDRLILERFFALLPRVDGACDARRGQLAAVGAVMVRGHDWEGASEVARVLRERCEDPRAHRVGRILTERIAWGRARSEDLSPPGR